MGLPNPTHSSTGGAHGLYLGHDCQGFWLGAGAGEWRGSYGWMSLEENLGNPTGYGGNP